MTDLIFQSSIMRTQKTLLIRTIALIGLALLIFWGAYSLRNDDEPVPEENQAVVSPKIADSRASLRDSIVTYGTDLLGTPYIEAGTDKNGFDCSGFVYYVFKHFKIEVPRSSPQYENFGKEVTINKVKKGDILVFLSPTNETVIGHLGIVTKANGMESDFIHATSGREMKVVITSLTNEGYKRRFVKAVNVIN